jgi:hypothetical protein
METITGTILGTPTETIMDPATAMAMKRGISLVFPKTIGVSPP